MVSRPLYRKKISQPALADCHVLSSVLSTFNRVLIVINPKKNLQAKAAAVIIQFLPQHSGRIYTFVEFTYVFSVGIILFLGHTIPQWPLVIQYHSVSVELTFKRNGGPNTLLLSLFIIIIIVIYPHCSSI